jgi:6-phosphogluconolactonase (cycloisomerase 2 family)
MKKKFTFGILIMCTIFLLMSCGGSITSDSDSTDTSSSGTFNSPAGIYTDGTYVYVADTGSNTIRQVVISTGSYAILAGSTLGAAGFSNGTGTAALFSAPSGITSDGTNLYVADKGNNVIRKIVISTGVVTTFAGSSTGASGFSNGTGTAALFSAPSGITSDGTYLYVSDTGNNSIRKIGILTIAVATL